MRIVALIACLFLAGPLAAGCVVRSDLDRGVKVAFSDGRIAELRRLPDGTIQMDEPWDHGLVVRTLSAHGIWEIESFDLGPRGEPAGSHLEMYYAEDPLGLPEPAPGLVWAGWATPMFEGTLLRSDVLTVRAAEGEPLVLGDCTYPALEVTVDVKRATEGPVALRYLYLPTLGFGVLLDREAEGEAAESRELVRLAPLGG